MSAQGTENVIIDRIRPDSHMTFDFYSHFRARWERDVVFTQEDKSAEVCMKGDFDFVQLQSSLVLDCATHIGNPQYRNWMIPVVPLTSSGEVLESCTLSRFQMVPDFPSKCALGTCVNSSSQVQKSSKSVLHEIAGPTSPPRCVDSVCFLQ